jgi:DNA-binding PadR family transcriptional regulator
MYARAATEMSTHPRLSYRILGLLRYKPLHPYQLSQRIPDYSYKAVVVTVMRLRKQGLVAPPNDERAYRLTDKGHALIGPARCPHCGKEID